MLNTIVSTASAIVLGLTGLAPAASATEAPAGPTAPAESAAPSSDATVPEVDPGFSVADADGNPISTTDDEDLAEDHVDDGAEVVESHRFSGSGTAAAAFAAWFDGDDFVQPDIETRDLVELELPNGEVAQAGDTVALYSDGFFSVVD